jgi:hypothetical protein
VLATPGKGLSKYRQLTQEMKSLTCCFKIIKDILFLFVSNCSFLCLRSTVPIFGNDSENLSLQYNQKMRYLIKLLRMCSLLLRVVTVMSQSPLLRKAVTDCVPTTEQVSPVAEGC